MTQDHHRRLARRIVLRQQQPAVLRLCAEQVEQVGGRPERFDSLWLFEPQQRSAPALRDRYLLERLTLRPKVDVLSRRGPVLRNVDAWGAQPEDCQPLRIRIRQRLEQQRVDHAEDSGVCADADGERCDDDERERGASSQRAQRVAEILQESVHECPRRRCRARMIPLRSY